MLFKLVPATARVTATVKLLVYLPVSTRIVLFTADAAIASDKVCVVGHAHPWPEVRSLVSLPAVNRVCDMLWTDCAI
jgi:hypothetical protein